MTLAPNQFEYDGEVLTRIDHVYNTTGISERGLELPIAIHWLEKYANRKPVLEVGNVLAYYDIPGERTVVDKYEVAPGVVNVDLFDVTDRYGLIISISTIEHVGQDYGEEYDPEGPAKAVAHLRSLLLPGGVLCVTMPYGWRNELDFNTLDASRVTSYYRVPQHVDWWASKWIPSARIPKEKRVYGKITPWANAVWVAEFDAI